MLKKNGTLSRIKSKKANVIFSACKKLKKHPLIYISSGKFAHQHLMPLNSLRQMETMVFHNNFAITGSSPTSMLLVPLRAKKNFVIGLNISKCQMIKIG